MWNPNKVFNESINALQSTEQTVIAGAEMIGNAPAIASEAKSIAQSAQNVANIAKSMADGALPKAGGTLSGPLILTATANESYDNTGVSSKWVKDYALGKLGATKTIHIGGENASDTANLFAGRGSENMPFATLYAALVWAANAYGGGTGGITFLLHEDAEWNVESIYLPLTFMFHIRGDVPERKLKLQNRFSSGKGMFYFSNMTFEGVSGKEMFQGYGTGSPVCFSFAENVTFTGSPSVGIVLSFGASCKVSFDINGSIPGKSYIISYGSKLFTAGKTIPGAAGTCDASSIFE